MEVNWKVVSITAGIVVLIGVGSRILELGRPRTNVLAFYLLVASFLALPCFILIVLIPLILWLRERRDVSVR